MANIIQLRRGTAAAWASANPTLASGEMGVETDTGRFKVGDGTSVWASLAYSSGPPGAVSPSMAQGSDGDDGPPGPPTPLQARTRSFLLKAEDATLDSGTAASLGSTPNQTRAVALADAATQGCFWLFAIPADWNGGPIIAQPIWSPGATDATPHTVRWTYVAKNISAGTTVTAAGTSTAWTGASAARTAAVVVFDTATSTAVTPAAPGDLFSLEVQRIGADGADTYVGVVNLLGVVITYTAVL